MQKEEDFDKKIDLELAAIDVREVMQAWGYKTVVKIFDMGINEWFEIFDVAIKGKIPISNVTRATRELYKKKFLLRRKNVMHTISSEMYQYTCSPLLKKIAKLVMHRQTLIKLGIVNKSNPKHDDAVTAAERKAFGENHYHIMLAFHRLICLELKSRGMEHASQKKRRRQCWSIAIPKTIYEKGEASKDFIVGKIKIGEEDMKMFDITLYKLIELGLVARKNDMFIIAPGNRLIVEYVC